jgi:subtilisin family serine protease
LALLALACERPAERIAGARLAAAASGNGTIGVNALLRAAPTAAQLAELGRYGTVQGTLPEINAVFLQARASDVPAIQALPFVLAANPDAERRGAPVDAVEVSDFAAGVSTWDLDAVNVTDFGRGRVVRYDGRGVYIGVLDTGLLDSWRQYFPEERIDQEHAAAVSGGGALDAGATPFTPNVWEHDQNSHGTHVTSTILGYNFRNLFNVNGTAPLATVIPVKVLNQAGFGWSSTIATGIVYVADLKAGPLAGHPVVINMSLGGPALDAVERAAIDYAIARGVILVAAAGNEGAAGMSFPGAYPPVISAAASGWIGEWLPGADGNPRNWWLADDVPDPTRAKNFYIAPFSSREKAGQDLDVAAPGSWVVGPFQTNSGQTSYFFLGGTSMATPHVAGIVALMAQKDPALTAAQAEAILEATATPLPAGCRTVAQPSGATSQVCWGADATGAGLATADAALAATP